MVNSVVMVNSSDAAVSNAISIVNFKDISFSEIFHLSDQVTFMKSKTLWTSYMNVF